MGLNLLSIDGIAAFALQDATFLLLTFLAHSFWPRRRVQAPTGGRSHQVQGQGYSTCEQPSHTAQRPVGWSNYDCNDTLTTRGLWRAPDAMSSYVVPCSD